MTHKGLAAALALCLATACTPVTHHGGPRGGATGSPAAGDAEPEERENTLETAEPDVGPAWLHGEYPAQFAEESYLIGVGAHQDAEEALARAEVQLALELWGPPEARPNYHRLPSVYVAKEDEKRQESLEDGRIAVLLAVKRETFADRIERWLEDTATDVPQRETVDDPAAHIAAVLAAAQTRALKEFACTRLRTITATSCSPPRGDNPLTLAASRVRIEPALEGGIPWQKGNAPLRPAGVFLRWQTSTGELVPWPAVPLLFTAPPDVLASDRATTNAAGYAEVEFAGVLAEEVIIGVSIDASRMFGNVQGAWPEVSTELGLRIMTSTNARVAVYFFEHVLQKESHEGVTAQATAEGLRSLGYRNARVLPEELSATLSSARSGAIRSAVRQLASSARGRADIIVLGEVDSDFVSRVGGRSVRHETHAVTQVYDVWTGRHMGDIERSVRVVGMGDVHAAREGMRQLGSQLAEALHQLFSSGDKLSAQFP